MNITNKSTVLPIIILFNPDLVLLQRLLDSLVAQAQSICIVDNSPSPNEEAINNLLSHYSNNFTYNALYDNVGIAKAQNIGIQHAKENSFSHVLLLDQDSALPENMINNLLKSEQELTTKGSKVAAIGPAFIDEKTQEIAPAINVKFLHTNKTPIDINSTTPVKADYIIASGSLIRLEILESLGNMREELFIDWVDIEWGERCQAYGYQSYITPTVLMQHSIGDESVRILGRNINLHSDFRNYFIVRNAMYLIHSSKMSKKSKLLFLIKIPQYIIFYSLASQKKLYSVKLLLKAVIDGMFSNMYKGHFK